MAGFQITFIFIYVFLNVLIAHSIIFVIKNLSHLLFREKKKKNVLQILKAVPSKSLSNILGGPF